MGASETVRRSRALAFATPALLAAGVAHAAPDNAATNLAATSPAATNLAVPDYGGAAGGAKAVLHPDAPLFAIPPLPTLPPLTLADFPLPEGAAARQRLRQICALIEREARRVDMPPAFFARLINRESRFDVRAVSPVGALGVAQFMPGTASDRGLIDPFDPLRAIPASADYLAEMRASLGNWGLAAAGYNAGPGRAMAFRAGGTLPGETRRYVRAVTGDRATAFRKKGAEIADRPLVEDRSFLDACMALPTIRQWPVLPEIGAPLAASGRFDARPILVAAKTDAPAPVAGSADPLGPVPAPAVEPAIAALVAADPADISVMPGESAGESAPAAFPRLRAPGTDLAPMPQLAAYPALPTLAPLLSLDFPLPRDAGRERATRQICGLIEREARRVGMPPAFFARLINQESRFDPRAVSPVGAQGVAQFMPYTARERGLSDPFEPVYAIPASADYLADLRDMLGNWGLAAAGYNAGPGRVVDFFGGRRLPPETRNYVLSITGLPATHFKTVANEVEAKPLDAKLPFMEACIKLPTMRFKRPKAPPGAEVPWQPWGVQLSASFVRASAVESFERQVKRYGKAAAGARPLVVRSRVPGLKRSKYAARIGAPSRTAADKICARIRAARGRCVVMKNAR